MRTLALLAAAGPGLVFGASGGVVLQGSIHADGPVRAVDAVTRNETGVAYLTSRRPAGVASWLAAGKASGGAAAFTIRVPDGVAPGQYFAGLLVGGASRHVVGIEVDVAGPQLARFVVGAVHVGRTRLYLHVTNAGNVAREPRGVVSISRAGGEAVAHVSLRMAAFLPHTSVDYPLPRHVRLAPGTYTASVRLTYAGVTSSAAPQFTVSRRPTFTPRAPGPPATPVAASRGGSSWPWLSAAMIAAVLAAAAAATLILRRRPVTVAATPVAPALAPARCEGFHYWDVDWQRPQTGLNGAVVYPHRCRRCGAEVLAVDIADAGRSCM